MVIICLKKMDMDFFVTVVIVDKEEELVLYII